MKCIFQNCDRPVLDEREGGEKICAVHKHWAYVVLADKRYRTEPVPVVTELGIQAVMFK